MECSKCGGRTERRDGGRAPGWRVCGSCGWTQRPAGESPWGTRACAGLVDGVLILYLPPRRVSRELPFHLFMAVMWGGMLALFVSFGIPPLFLAAHAAAGATLVLSILNVVFGRSLVRAMPDRLEWESQLFGLRWRRSVAVTSVSGAAVARDGGVRLKGPAEPPRLAQAASPAEAAWIRDMLADYYGWPERRVENAQTESAAEPKKQEPSRVRHETSDGALTIRIERRGWRGDVRGMGLFIIVWLLGVVLWHVAACQTGSLKDGDLSWRLPSKIEPRWVLFSAVMFGGGLTFLALILKQAFQETSIRATRDALAWSTRLFRWSWGGELPASAIAGAELAPNDGVRGPGSSPDHGGLRLVGPAREVRLATDVSRADALAIRGLLARFYGWPPGV